MNKTFRWLVAMSIVAGLQASGRAGEMETLASGAAMKFRVLESGVTREKRFKDRRGIKPVYTALAGFGRGEKGGAGGLDMELPLTRSGSDSTISAVLGLGGFTGSSRTPRQTLDGRWKEHTLGGGPLFGFRVRPDRYGRGTADGKKGVFLQPILGAGIVPFSQSLTTLKQSPGDRAGAEGTRTGATLYLEAAFDLQLGNRVSLGVGAKRFLDFAQPDEKVSVTTVGVSLLQDILK